MSSSDPISMPLWPVRPPPQPQELFTGWLVRIAQAHGITPRLFISQLRANARAGHRDLDVSPSYEMIAEVSRRTAVPYSRIVRMTVRWHVDPVIGGRVRDADTFACCPLCWREDPSPYVRRAWRLAWTPICIRHRTPLGGFCPQCRHFPAFESTSAAHSICRCQRCSFDLRRMETGWPGPLSKAAIDREVQVQDRRFRHFESTYYDADCVRAEGICRNSP